MKVRSRIVDSIAADIDAIRQRIASRAALIFQGRDGGSGLELEDWLTAERETIWRPPIEVVRTDDAFIVEVAAAGVEPRLLDVRVTPTELLLSARVHHSDREQEGDVLLCEFASGPLFRTFAFPEPIDPSRVSADCRNGMLRLVAPLAQPATACTSTSPDGARRSEEGP